MGKIKILAFLITLSLLTFFSRSVQSQEILRIHIIANSNSPQDQFVKYQVRDEIMNNFREELSKLKSQRDLNEFISENLDEMVDISITVLSESGYKYSAKAEVGDFDFPTRMYMETVYPSGTYKAVRVVLGEGAGDNWWCVMFPPLCFVGEVKENSENIESGSMAQELDVEYDFIIVKWVKGVVSFLSNIF
ncbi:stage II sporulation protein R [Alkalicella caledoniensis]|uniref:Stage II sporulation protein R n=1 Tax=Alkalicella caledoniensis TaxID=2731377 RepID=A0A7G9W8Y1_ALKCA|nr:stage II sporulation protein R [Alkalicella caledoniensis]QNO15143.1 stage II sporulation protein R [Alkalicella caledoniensis]